MKEHIGAERGDALFCYHGVLRSIWGMLRQLMNLLPVLPIR